MLTATSSSCYIGRTRFLFAENVTALIFDDESIPALPELPRSGSTVVGDCYAAEYCSNDIHAIFTAPQREVGLAASGRVPRW